MKEKIKRTIKDILAFGQMNAEKLLAQICSEYQYYPNFDEWIAREAIWELTADGEIFFTPGFKALYMEKL